MERTPVPGINTIIRKSLHMEAKKEVFIPDVRRDGTRRKVEFLAGSQLAAIDVENRPPRCLRRCPDW